MNVNFGLFAPLEENVHKKSRKAAMTGRARVDLQNWISKSQVAV
jgi:methylenetetrahydrofolate--tRNA-(uracil-5-)-methyltransferase